MIPSLPATPAPDYSLCGFSSVHGDVIVVMDSYEAYLDESGAHHSRFLVVGGYIADINAWAELSVSWKAILDEYKLPYFRMTDYKNSHSRLFHHLSRTNKEHVLDALLK